MKSIIINPTNCTISNVIIEYLHVITKWAKVVLHNGHIDGFQELIIVQQGYVNDFANKLISSYADDKKKIITRADAIALPIISKGIIKCWIILDESLVNSIDVNNNKYNLLASTVLEEFLHIKHYFLTFSRRGFVQYPDNHSDLCTVWLLNLTFYLLSEYLAGRWKAELIEGELSFGLNLPEYIDRSLFKLASTISDFSEGIITLEKATKTTHSVLAQELFGALVRESSRRASHPGKESPAGTPSDSQNYRKYLEPYWRSIHQKMERVFNDFSESDHYELAIANDIRSFLISVGISLRPNNQGGCWIYYEKSWAETFFKHEHNNSS